MVTALTVFNLWANVNKCGASQVCQVLGVRCVVPGTLGDT